MMNRFSTSLRRASRSLSASLSFRGASLLVLASLAATSQILGGCIGAREIGDVSGDGGGSSGKTGTGTTTTGTLSSMMTGPIGESGSGGGQGGSDGIAVLNEQVPSGDKPGWNSDGKTLEPKTLIVSLLDRSQTCAAPKFNHSGPKSYTELIFGLSPSVQKVGKYDVASPDVLSVYDYYLGDGMGNGGGRGASPLTEGTIEVLSIDDTAIHVRTELPPDAHGDGADRFNGDYLVPRCP